MDVEGFYKSTAEILGEKLKQQVTELSINPESTSKEVWGDYVTEKEKGKYRLSQNSDRSWKIEVATFQ